MHANAELSAVESQLALADAVGQYVAKVEEGEIKQARAIELVRSYGRMAGLTKGQLAELIERIRETGDAYDELPESTKTKVDVEGVDDAIEGIDARARALRGVPTTLITTLRTVQTGGGERTCNTRADRPEPAPGVTARLSTPTRYPPSCNAARSSFPRRWLRQASVEVVRR